jgi:hypothetical protein
MRGSLSLETFKWNCTLKIYSLLQNYNFSLEMEVYSGFFRNLFFLYKAYFCIVLRHLVL